MRSMRSIGLNRSEVRHHVCRIAGEGRKMIDRVRDTGEREGRGRGEGGERDGRGRASYMIGRVAYRGVMGTN